MCCQQVGTEIQYDLWHDRWQLQCAATKKGAESIVYVRLSSGFVNESVAADDSVNENYIDISLVPANVR